MSLSLAFRTASVTAALGLSLLTAGCASDSGSDEISSTNSPTRDASESAQEFLEDALDDQGEDGRILDTSDEDVLTVVEQTLSSQNAKAAWDGNELRVEVDGSVDDPTAATPCLMLEAFLADGQEAVLVYGDGGIRCSER